MQINNHAMCTTGRIFLVILDQWLFRPVLDQTARRGGFQYQGCRWIKQKTPKLQCSFQTILGNVVSCVSVLALDGGTCNGHVYFPPFV